MPRYFFHSHDGVCFADSEGTVLNGPSEARHEAVRLAGAIICQEADKLTPGEDWHLDVTDATGLVLFRLVFVVNEAPPALPAIGKGH